VYPGGKTRCFDGGAYAFAVVPGDKDKLLFYFEGGGACWEAKGNVVRQCTEGMDYGIQTTGLGTGIQNRTNPNNPLRSYTVVEPIYCGGDAFMGTKTQDWSGKTFYGNTANSNSTTFYQHGYENALAALNWAKENFDGELESLVLAGFSAGSLGTMAWSRTMLSAFKYKYGHVLLDSYVGVFPPSTQGPTLLEWGACDTDLFSPKLQADCKKGVLQIQEPYMEAMAQFPNVGFGSIQSKVDGTQIWFYKGLAMSNFMMGDDGAKLTDPTFYAKSLEVLQELNKYPNFVEILVNGDQHCYTDEDAFFTATTAGKDGGAGEPLTKWVDDFIHNKAASECEGVIENGPDAKDGDKYCDQKLLPKVLITSK